MNIRTASLATPMPHVAIESRISRSSSNTTRFDGVLLGRMEIGTWQNPGGPIRRPTRHPEDRHHSSGVRGALRTRDHQRDLRTRGPRRRSRGRRPLRVSGCSSPSTRRRASSACSCSFRAPARSPWSPARRAGLGHWRLGRRGAWRPVVAGQGDQRRSPLRGCSGPRRRNRNTHTRLPDSCPVVLQSCRAIGVHHEHALLEVQLQLELDEQRGVPPLSPRARALQQARASGDQQA
jgi:hypothetical protein